MLLPLMKADPSESFFFQSAQNYESYLLLLASLVYILTDENAEIRLFATMQNLRIGLLPFKNHNDILGQITLETEGPLCGRVIGDTNDFLTVRAIFETLTH